VDGNYSHVRDILWPLASTILIIDLPKRVVMTRVVKRTLLRIMKREELWNGNRESWRNVLSRDPMRNIILWAWNTHEKYHEILPVKRGRLSGSTGLSSSRVRAKFESSLEKRMKNSEWRDSD